MGDSILNNIDGKVQRANLYEIVADKLEEIILSDVSQLGQKLPSEQALATRFGVSRNIVREALKLLRERELIVAKNGEGSYIAKPRAKNVTNVLNRMMTMDNIDFTNVFEMRMLLEPYACRVAAKKGTSEQFDALERNIEQMAGSKDDSDARIRYDLQFHRMIAEMSGNKLLDCFIQSMSSLLKPILRQALIPPQGHQSGIQYHQRLVSVLRAGDEAEAERLMTEHLNVSFENYKTSNQYR